MDVHKDIIVSTVAMTNKKSRITKYIQETFSTLNPNLLRLKFWFIDHKCFDACMESMGKNWMPIYNVLEDEINIYLNTTSSSFLLSRQKKLEHFEKYLAIDSNLLACTLERNRYQNCMTVSNIRLAFVVSDSFDKSTQAIMKEVLQSNVINDDKILKSVHGRCKNKDKILDSIKNNSIDMKGSR